MSSLSNKSAQEISELLNEYGIKHGPVVGRWPVPFVFESTFVAANCSGLTRVCTSVKFISEMSFIKLCLWSLFLIFVRLWPDFDIQTPPEHCMRRNWKKPWPKGRQWSHPLIKLITGRKVTYYVMKTHISTKALLFVKFQLGQNCAEVHSCDYINDIYIIYWIFIGVWALQSTLSTFILHFLRHSQRLY